MVTIYLNISNSPSDVPWKIFCRFFSTLNGFACSPGIMDTPVSVSQPKFPSHFWWPCQSPHLLLLSVPLFLTVTCVLCHACFSYFFGTCYMWCGPRAWYKSFDVIFFAFYLHDIHLVVEIFSGENFDLFFAFFLMHLFICDFYLEIITFLLEICFTLMSHSKQRNMHILITYAYDIYTQVNPYLG